MCSSPRLEFATQDTCRDLARNIGDLPIAKGIAQIHRCRWGHGKGNLISHAKGEVNGKNEKKVESKSTFGCMSLAPIAG